MAKNILRERRRDAARTAGIDRHAQCLVRSHAAVTADAAAPGTAAEADVEALRRALPRLPTKFRVALELYYLQEMPTAQAAAAAGCTPVAFRRRLTRARRSLRTLLTKGGAPDSAAPAEA
jgi:RNA polymerase sigma factor (sigma-70 family)